VIAVAQLPREAHNAPLHLFSASPDLVKRAGGTYRRRSEQTSGLLDQLFKRLEGEGFAMAYTMQDFQRDYIKEHFPELTPDQQREVLKRLPAARRREVLEALPPEERLAGLSPEDIQQYLERLTKGRPTGTRKPRRKK
jgi:hypothetical protein